MSETKHTPGPWRTDARNGFPLDIEDPGEYMIAKATPCAKAEANARLISAAPDLLDALKELLDREWQDDEGDYTLEMAHRKARAAISKATGEYWRVYERTT